MPFSHPLVLRSMEDVYARLRDAESRSDALSRSRENTKAAHAAGLAAHQAVVEQLESLARRSREALGASKGNLAQVESRLQWMKLNNRALVNDGSFSRVPPALDRSDQMLANQSCLLIDARLTRLTRTAEAERAGLACQLQLFKDELNTIDQQMVTLRAAEMDVLSTFKNTRATMADSSSSDEALRARRARIEEEQSAANNELRRARESFDMLCSAVDVLRGETKDAPLVDRLLREHSQVLRSLQERLFVIRQRRGQLPHRKQPPTAKQISREAAAAEDWRVKAESSLAERRETLRRELENLSMYANALHRRLVHEELLGTHLAAHEALRCREVQLLQHRNF